MRHKWTPTVSKTYQRLATQTAKATPASALTLPASAILIVQAQAARRLRQMPPIALLLFVSSQTSSARRKPTYVTTACLRTILVTRNFNAQADAKLRKLGATLQSDVRTAAAKAKQSLRRQAG